MKKTAHQVLLLLASSTLKPDDIKAALYALLNLPPEELVWRIREIRRHAQSLTGEWPSTKAQPWRGPTEPVGHDVPARVEWLLRTEGGLTVSTAANALIDLIREQADSEGADLRPPNRESFLKWLRRLAEHIPASQLLHYATQIRNESVHRPDVDWSLRDRPDKR